MVNAVEFILNQLHSFGMFSNPASAPTAAAAGAKAAASADAAAAAEAAASLGRHDSARCVSAFGSPVTSLVTGH